MYKTNVVAELELEHVTFVPDRCFKYDNSVEDRKCLDLLVSYLSKKQDIVFYRANKLCSYILDYSPELRSSVKFILDENSELHTQNIHGISVIPPERLPDSCKSIFICLTRWYSIHSIKKKIPQHIDVITPDILKELDWTVIPQRAWLPKADSIYPIDIPDINFMPEMDLILLDTPARSIAQMPVGFGYVHNAMQKTKIKFQTVDADIVIYHRYHSHRILDGAFEMFTPGGHKMPDDPWQPVHYLEWTNPDFVEFFRTDIDEIVRGIIQARPKILGLSLQQVNISFAREVVKGVTKGLPDVVVLVGGMSCYQPQVGRKVFPEAHYMVIGEADLIVGPLVEQLARGERPCNVPGVISSCDTPDRIFEVGPVMEDIDINDFPRYEWTDISLYRNFNDYRLTPVLGSRGCRWARCTFCGERFYWRKRRPEKVVEELTWLLSKGFDNFVINDSDFNGDPDNLLVICDEIVKRKLNIRLSGQLRINKHSNKEFFIRLRAAGFVHMRFGVDAWSQNALRLQRKGYTKDIIRQNLRDCAMAGISTDVNIVLGIPGETEQDIDETIEFLIENKPYINSVPFINPLMLFVGSIYYLEPEKHNIVFRKDKKKLYEESIMAIPWEDWYSTEPYIDQNIRRQRFNRVVRALRNAGFNMGSFAEYTVEQVSGSQISSAEENDTHERSKGEEVTHFLSPYKKYNLFSFKGLVYGIPNSMIINLQKKEDREKIGLIVGERKEQVENVIDKFEKRDSETSSLHQFPIVRTNDEFYRIRLDDTSLKVISSEIRTLSPDEPRQAPVEQMASPAEQRKYIISDRILKGLYEHYVHWPVPIRKVTDKPVFLMIRLYKNISRDR